MTQGVPPDPLDSPSTIDTPASTMPRSRRGHPPAMGYLQLGMMEEADDEIENLTPKVKTQRIVLGIRALIFQGTHC